MSVANVTMFEFQTSESIEEFASWYKVMGLIPIMTFLFSFAQERPLLSVYPTEQDRQKADKLRNESASTASSEIVKEIIPLSGDVLVHFLKGRLLE